jgi:pimeloyl-ACP methyl ester carboxylesterase
VVQQGGAARREPSGIQKADDPGKSETKMNRLGKWLRKGLSAVSSAITSTGDAVIEGYKATKEIGAHILEVAADAGTTAATAFVSAAKATGQAMYDAGVQAGIAAVDFKDAAVTKAKATAEKLGELAIAAGTAMVDAAIAGADAVVDTAKATKGFLKDKGILPPSILTSGGMADTIKADRPLELIAHGLAYSYPSVQEPETLEAAGYDTSTKSIGAFTDPIDGLQYVWIKPRTDEAGKPLTDPILGFRGTADMSNVISDADPSGVGHMLFEKHTTDVQAKMSELSLITGKVLVTGHSLGGSLAQRAALLAPGLVARLVTFQSPGISFIAIDKLEQLAGNVTHHIATKDVVDLAGGYNVPGAYIVHQIPGYHTPLTHTAHLLKDDNQKMWPYEKYPWSYKLKAMPTEVMRDVIGVALAPFVLGYRGLKKFVNAASSGASALGSYIGEHVPKLFATKTSPGSEESPAD